MQQTTKLSAHGNGAPTLLQSNITATIRNSLHWDRATARGALFLLALAALLIGGASNHGNLF